MPSSPSKTSIPIRRRQLITPTTHIPWSVDVSSAVPKALVEKLDSVITGATCVGWMCLGLHDGNHLVWQPKTTNLSQASLEAPKHCTTVYLPDMKLTTQQLQDGTCRPLLALATTARDEKDSVHLYAAHPTTGWLILRKITRKDLYSKLPVPKPHHIKVRIPLEEDEQVVALVASSSSPLDGMIALGTSHGNIFWVTQTSVPVSLHVQKVVVQAGLWNRIFYGGQVDTDDSEVSFLLPTTSATDFQSISKEGTLVHWKVTTPVANAHHATFEANSLGNLASTLASLSPPYFLTDIVVLQATLSADCQSIHFIVGAVDKSELKIFWIHCANKPGLPLEHDSSPQWLSRFSSPENVQVLGLVTTDNGNAYAAFTTGGAVVVMVWPSNQSIIQEVDLPLTQVPRLLPQVFFKDVVTHGCSAIASSGIGIRIRYMPPNLPNAPTPSSKSRSKRSSTPVSTLVAHLRGAFWPSYQDPETPISHRNLPPSLSSATVTDLEQAVMEFASELQRKGDAASSTQNPLEWHVAFVNFLQQGGLYRSISTVGRWQLLSMGQELAVFGKLPLHTSARSATLGATFGRYLSEFPSCGIADWLLSIQTKEFESSNNSSRWCSWLCCCLEAAKDYRADQGVLFYDVPETPTIGEGASSWISHPSLQFVLVEQLKAWKKDFASASERVIEIVVEAALVSFAEAFPQDPKALDEYKKEYADVKKLAISLLRNVKKGNDGLAFELSTRFHYFEGLCQIALDHEPKEDAETFSLEPLFATLEGRDLLTDFTFIQYVLQWHADKGYFGHVLNHGRHSIGDLNAILNHDERLRPYKWIHAIRQKNYNGATESFVSTSRNGQEKLSVQKWSLSMAKLTNKLQVSRNQLVALTQRNIERRLELIQAQELLFEGTADKSKMNRLLPAEELVDLAMKQISEATDNDDRMRLLLIGLAVSASMPERGLENAAIVWAYSLTLDMSLWKEWMRTQTNFMDTELRSTAMNTTLFGSLLKECRKDNLLKEVAYARHLESTVMEKLGRPPFQTEFCRLLRAVTINPDAIEATSLVVASY